MEKEQRRNQLSLEKSSYLLQHKDNPVHWQAWGPEALQLARDENKPVFLSIGYSTCHWCHVMAHESFEDPATAEFLNTHYISIKVDREEYPDLDHYYQLACQVIRQSRGGWPLSVFCLPDGRPFHVGTYFPPEPKYGMPSFKQLLAEVARVWKEEHDKVETTAGQVAQIIENGLPFPEGFQMAEGFAPPDAILAALESMADIEWGGYGQAPKFPNFSFLEWAVEQHLECRLDEDQSRHILGTVEKMLLGGICDHALGGIHRYSTDREWKVPHFEKMLYDQAGYLRLLARHSMACNRPLVFDALANALRYLEQEMLDPVRHYFYAAQDADSEGAEGRYFVFTEKEFDSALESHPVCKSELIAGKDLLKKWMGISPEGNFEHGQHVLRLLPAFASEYHGPNWELIRKAREALFLARQPRVRPGCDRKGIASWNFMMLSALADVVQYCPDFTIKNHARALLDKTFAGITNVFYDAAQRTIRHVTTRDASLQYLEDHVFLAEAQLRNHEATGDGKSKTRFKEMLVQLLSDFADLSAGRVYTRSLSAGQEASYPNQQVTTFDGSFRSPASTLALLILKGAVLFSDREMISKAETLFAGLQLQALNNPLGSGEALRAFTCPKEKYQKIQVPHRWLHDKKWLAFRNGYPWYCVFDYHHDEDDHWEICSLTACHYHGNGMEEMMKKGAILGF